MVGVGVAGAGGGGAVGSTSAGNWLTVTASDAILLFERPAALWVLRDTIEPPGGQMHSEVLVTEDGTVFAWLSPARAIVQYENRGGDWMEVQRIEDTGGLGVSGASIGRAFDVRGDEMWVGTTTMAPDPYQAVHFTRGAMGRWEADDIIDVVTTATWGNFEPAVGFDGERVALSGEDNLWVYDMVEGTRVRISRLPAPVGGGSRGDFTGRVHLAEDVLVVRTTGTFTSGTSIYEGIGL